MKTKKIIIGLSALAIMGTSYVGAQDIYNLQTPATGIQVPASIDSGTDIGGGLTPAELMAWCNQNNIYVGDILEEAKEELLDTGDYHLASKKLVDEIRGLLVSDMGRRVLGNSYLAKVLARIINLHAALGGNALVNNPRQSEIIFSLLEDYILKVKSIAYRLDQSRAHGEGIASYELQIMRMTQEQAQLMIDFHIVDIEDGQPMPKDTQLFVKSVDFIAGEVANDIANASFMAERYSCAYQMAKRAQRPVTSRRETRLVYKKYDRFMDFLTNMNDCSAE